MTDDNEYTPEPLDGEEIGQQGPEVIDLNTLDPRIAQQLLEFHNQLNPKMVAVTIIAVLSNGKTEIQSSYNPNGLRVVVSDEAAQQGNDS